MARSSESDDARLASSIAVLQIAYFLGRRPSYTSKWAELCFELAYTDTRVFGLSQLLGHALGIGTAQASIMARFAAVLSASIAAVAAAEPKVTNKAEIQRLNSRDLPAVPTVRRARGIEAH